VKFLRCCLKHCGAPRCRIYCARSPISPYRSVPTDPIIVNTPVSSRKSVSLPRKRMDRPGGTCYNNRKRELLDPGGLHGAILRAIRGGCVCTFPRRLFSRSRSVTSSIPTDPPSGDRSGTATGAPQLRRSEERYGDKVEGTGEGIAGEIERRRRVGQCRIQLD